MKSLVKFAVGFLPYKLKRYISAELVSLLRLEDCYKIVTLLAPRLNINRISVCGDLGEFETLSHDNTMLPIYAVRGVWAAPTINCLRLFFESGQGDYIDIGANIGLTTVPIAKLGIKCFSFEPEPNNFLSLTLNLRKNLVDQNVVTYEIALSDRVGLAELCRSPNNLGDHRLGRPVDNCSTERLDTIHVKTMPLDSMGLTFSGPLGVKIDAQGAEPLIIKGATSILSRAGVLILEYSPYHMKRFVVSPSIILDFLDNNFEKIALIKGDGSNFVFYEDKSKAVEFLAREFYELIGVEENEESYYDIFAFQGVGNACFEELKTRQQAGDLA